MSLKVVNTIYFLKIAQKRCEWKLDETSTIDSKNAARIKLDRKWLCKL